MGDSSIRVGIGWIFRGFYVVGEGVVFSDDAPILPFGCLADLNFGGYNEGLPPRR